MQFITNEDGQKTAVVLPIEAYENLLEDIEVLAVLVERRDDASIPHAEMISDLKRDGLL